LKGSIKLVKKLARLRFFVSILVVYDTTYVIISDRAVQTAYCKKVGV